jgi:hypothetical protein
MAIDSLSDKKITTSINPYQPLSAQLEKFEKYYNPLWGYPISDEEFDDARLKCKRAQTKNNFPMILCYNFGEPYETLANLAKLILDQEGYWYRNNVDPSQENHKTINEHRKGILIFDDYSIKLAEKTLKYETGFNILYGINVSDDQKRVGKKTLSLVRNQQISDDEEYLVHAEGMYAYVQLLDFYRSIGMKPPHIKMWLSGYEIKSRSKPGEIFNLCLCQLPGDLISKIRLKSAASNMDDFVAPKILMR